MSLHRSARCAAFLCLALTANAHAYDRIQPPEILSGQRAGLAGDLSKLAIGPGDVERGAFSLPTPFAAPGDRGELQAKIFPTYNPDNGISAWGIGFDTSLAIKRTRILGSIDYTDADELSSPFGRLVRGTDGDWYPVGLEPRVRVHRSGDELIAYMPDGSTQTFGGSARVATAKGTYAWNLREVRSATDQRTTLTWKANPSGELYLESVRYGGRHGNAQYRIDLAYESVVATDGNDAEKPRFVDYRAGIPLTMDRRVSTVTMLALVNGAFKERWHYTLHYIEEPVAAAFYLARIDKTFASGETAPPITYGYNLRSSRLAASQLTEVPQLTQLFQQLGVAGDIVQPQWSAVADADMNGNEDLELGTADRTLVLTKGSGTADDPLHYELQPLPAANAPACQTEDGVGCVWAPCRPSPSYDSDRMAPRILAQLNPSDPHLDVVAFRYDGDANETEVSVCTREGVRIGRTVMQSSWTPRDTVRFVDLDHDHLPDFVRVSAGRFEILPNTTSADQYGTTYRWGAPITGNLLNRYGDPVDVSDVWVSDASGDGIPDLESVVGDSLYVWHGLGNFEFEETAETFSFVQSSGEVLSGVDQLELIPADLNKDGLQDFFITNRDQSQSRVVRYFTNVGAKFVETRIPALEQLSYTASSPVIGGFDASGNSTITVTDLGHAYSITLDGPDTGLMAYADDGKGTIVRFDYARGPAEPGIRHRCALLARLEIQTSGYDTIAYDYRYEGVKLHSIGRFPLGFSTVVRREPLGTTTLHFENEDRYTGVLLSSDELDARVPTMVKILERDYDDATLAGVPWRRLRSEKTGWRTLPSAAEIVDTTTYDAYAGVCPARTTATTSQGKLVTEATYADVLPNHLHCLESRVVRTGTHDDPALDFTSDQSIARNAAGQMTQLATGANVEQRLAYDGDGDVTSIEVPGSGTTTITYQPGTKLIASITGPDGVVNRVDARNPLTDQIQTRATARGNLVFQEQTQFDGQERLIARSNNVDGSETYAYRYASTNTPASVLIRTLVDTGSYRERVELYSGADEKLGTAVHAPDGWVFDGFDAVSRASRKRDHFIVDNQHAFPATLDYATLLGASPKRITSTTSSAFAFDTATSQRFHTAVERAVSTTLTTDGFDLVRTELVNAQSATTKHLDLAGKLTLSFTDEAGSTWHYRYDALGRLRMVTLPDGSHHRTTYDNYGRLASIHRDGVAGITYAYRPLTDKVDTITWSSPSGVAMRKETFGYDAAGHITSRTDVDLATLASKTFTFEWSGGLQTGVAGPDFAKTFGYRADGKLVHRAIAIPGYRTIETNLDYFADGRPRQRAVTVENATGTALSTTTTQDDVDAFGRITGTSLDGVTLAEYAYDSFDRTSTIAFANNDALTFEYDPLTRAPMGRVQTRADGAWGGDAIVRTLRNARGFASEETQSVGTDHVVRSYDYSAQGWLSGVTDTTQGQP